MNESPRNQNVDQTVGTNQGSVQGGAAGRDANFHQDNSRNVNINLNPELPQLEELASGRALFNYILALVFLIGVLIGWFLLGIFAKCKFPTTQILGFVLASFEGNKGLDSFWKEVENQYQEKIGLGFQEFNNHEASLQNYRNLNKQESEIWLLTKLIEIIASGSQSENQELEKAIEVLEKQREYFFLNLIPLKKKFDPDLDRLQKIYARIIEGYSSVEIDYKKINKILGALAYKFTINSKPSADEVTSLVEELQQIVIANPHDISESRLETLHNVLQLLKWALAASQNQTYQYEFLAEVDSIRRRKALEVIIEQIKEVLRKGVPNVQNKALEAIEKGIRQQWIDTVSVYGLNYKGLSVVELAVRIDWNKFNEQRNSWLSDGTVEITWDGKTAIQL